MIQLFGTVFFLAIDLMLPPLELAEFLPPRSLTRMALSQNTDYEIQVKRRLDLYPHNERLVELMAETKRRHQLWDKCDDVQRGELSAWRRRMHLADLMRLLGWQEEDVCHKRLPMPVPGLED